MTHGSIIAATKQWVETVVVGLNLCPFARRPLLDGRVRFTVTDAETEAELIEALHSELSLLTEDPTVETTLLIHPKTLLDFYDFNDFLSIADDLVLDLALQGVVQIASFHPDYQFEGTAPDDIQNDTNRSPSPMLQLLREADATGKAISFANEQVETAKTAIEGLPLGGTEDLLRDLADSVVARSR